VEQHELTIGEFTVSISGSDATITNPVGYSMYLPSKVLRDLGKFAEWVLLQQDPDEAVEPPSFDIPF
jgi:hypothetical protein